MVFHRAVPVLLACFILFSICSTSFATYSDEAATYAGLGSGWGSSYPSGASNTWWLAMWNRLNDIKSYQAAYNSGWRWNGNYSSTSNSSASGSFYKYLFDVTESSLKGFRWAQSSSSTPSDTSNTSYTLYVAKALKDIYTLVDVNLGSSASSALYNRLTNIWTDTTSIKNSNTSIYNELSALNSKGVYNIQYLRTISEQLLSDDYSMQSFFAEMFRFMSKFDSFSAENLRLLGNIAVDTKSLVDWTMGIYEIVEDELPDIRRQAYQIFLTNSRFVEALTFGEDDNRFPINETSWAGKLLKAVYDPTEIAVRDASDNAAKSLIDINKGVFGSSSVGNTTSAIGEMNGFTHFGDVIDTTASPTDVFAFFGDSQNFSYFSAEVASDLDRVAGTRGEGTNTVKSMYGTDEVIFIDKSYLDNLNKILNVGKR